MSSHIYLYLTQVIERNECIKMTKIKESKNPTIKDVKDILDINKYLKKVEKDVKSLDHILGAGLLTLSQYI